MSEPNKSNINLNNVEKEINQVDSIIKLVKDTAQELEDILRAKDMFYFIAVAKKLSDENHNFLTTTVNMPPSHIYEMLKSLFSQLNFIEISHVYSKLVERLAEIMPKKGANDGEDNLLPN